MIDLRATIITLLQQCELVDHLPSCATTPRLNEKGTPSPYCTCGRAAVIRVRQAETMARVIHALGARPEDPELAEALAAEMARGEPRTSPWKESVTLDEVIELLNEAVKRDTEWISRLVQVRVPCNQALAEHPTIQVGKSPEFNLLPGTFCAGTLGLLNGLFGIDEEGWGPIAAVADKPETAAELLTVTRFERTPVAKLRARGQTP